MSDVDDQIKETTIAPPPRCSFCQATRGQHAELERAGELHHQFSERGELVHSKPEQKNQRVMVAPDLVLRMALLDAGVITEGQLTLAEAKIRASVSGGDGGSDPADRGPRSAESS